MRVNGCNGRAKSRAVRSIECSASSDEIFNFPSTSGRSMTANAEVDIPRVSWSRARSAPSGADVVRQRKRRMRKARHFPRALARPESFRVVSMPRGLIGADRRAPTSFVPLRVFFQTWSTRDGSSRSSSRTRVIRDHANHPFRSTANAISIKIISNGGARHHFRDQPNVLSDSIFINQTRTATPFPRQLLVPRADKGNGSRRSN